MVELASRCECEKCSGTGGAWNEEEEKRKFVRCGDCFGIGFIRGKL